MHNFVWIMCVYVLIYAQVSSVNEWSGGADQMSTTGIFIVTSQCSLKDRLSFNLELTASVRMSSQ